MYRHLFQIFTYIRTYLYYTYKLIKCRRYVNKKHEIWLLRNIITYFTYNWMNKWTSKFTNLEFRRQQLKYWLLTIKQWQYSRIPQYDENFLNAIFFFLMFSINSRKNISFEIIYGKNVFWILFRFLVKS